MNDKQWLERVTLAYKVYSAGQPAGAQIQIELFIKWLYDQYGIVQPKQ